MEPGSLDTMLEKLQNGEDAAAERVFRDFEPYLRSLVRRRLTPPLRSKFDSMDVVQSVWGDVLEGFREGRWEFKDRDHLRAFLARVTYRPFRQPVPPERRRPEARAAAPPGRCAAIATPPPSPVPARSRRPTSCGRRWASSARRPIASSSSSSGRGSPPAEIGARIGLHEGSVRRILYDLAKRLAATVERGRVPRVRPIR